MQTHSNNAATPFKPDSEQHRTAGVAGAEVALHRHRLRDMKVPQLLVARGLGDDGRGADDRIDRVGLGAHRELDAREPLREALPVALRVTDRVHEHLRCKAKVQSNAIPTPRCNFTRTHVGVWWQACLKATSTLFQCWRCFASGYCAAAICRPSYFAIATLDSQVAMAPQGMQLSSPSSCATATVQQLLCALVSMLTAVRFTPRVSASSISRNVASLANVFRPTFSLQPCSPLLSLRSP